MNSDEHKVRVAIDLHYELGRTDPKDLVPVLLNAADHLFQEGLMSGDTEASVLSYAVAVVPQFVVPQLVEVKTPEPASEPSGGKPPALVTSTVGGFIAAHRYRSLLVFTKDAVEELTQFCPEPNHQAALQALTAELEELDALLAKTEKLVPKSE